MILDWNSSLKVFFLRVPRAEADQVRPLMTEHGLDYSYTASTKDEAILVTREPYAAVAFHAHGTGAAKHELRHLQAEIDLSWASEGKGHVKCPADQEPWPFQKDGVAYALRRKHTLIGDQPGLGKGPQAIMVCNEINAKRVLVICPANIRLQWVQFIRRWSTMEWPYHVYPIIKGKNGANPVAQWTVVSYDLARTPGIHGALMQGLYDVAILDEIHFLKTIDSLRTRAIFGGGVTGLSGSLVDRCGMLLGLSGTPLPNRPREAYTVARGLCFDSIDFASEEKFSDRFNPSREVILDSGKRFIDERTGRHGELQARLRSNFMVRREKHGPRGVMGQLKLPIYDIVHVEETGPVKAALKAESLLHLDLDHLPGPSDPEFGAIATARRLMGVAVAPLAAEYAEMCLVGGEDKIVVFGHHIEVLDIIQRRLEKYGVVRIDGRTSATAKQERVDRFRVEPGVRVCLGNMQSMGTGTDGLQQVASHAIFAEADWTPGVNQQGVDRLDRGGQLGQVQADFLVAPSSLSERVLAAALEKNHITHKALDRII